VILQKQNLFCNPKNQKKNLTLINRELLEKKVGSKISLTDIKKDFESYVGNSISEQTLGYFLKKHGMIKNNSNGQTCFKG